MQESLNGKRVAILVTDGFEQVEMTEPRHALDQAGARVSIVSPAAGGKAREVLVDKGYFAEVDAQLR